MDVGEATSQVCVQFGSCTRVCLVIGDEAHRDGSRLTGQHQRPRKNMSMLSPPRRRVGIDSLKHVEKQNSWSKYWANQLVQIRKQKTRHKSPWTSMCVAPFTWMSLADECVEEAVHIPYQVILEGDPSSLAPGKASG